MGLEDLLENPSASIADALERKNIECNADFAMADDQEILLEPDLVLEELAKQCGQMYHSSEAERESVVNEEWEPYFRRLDNVCALMAKVNRVPTYAEVVSSVGRSG